MDNELEFEQTFRDNEFNVLVRGMLIGTLKPRDPEYSDDTPDNQWVLWSPNGQDGVGVGATLEEAKNTLTDDFESGLFD